MKVGTDAVLLGAWCNVDNPNNKESRTAAKALEDCEISWRKAIEVPVSCRFRAVRSYGA